MRWDRAGQQQPQLLLQHSQARAVQHCGLFHLFHEDFPAPGLCLIPLSSPEVPPAPGKSPPCAGAAGQAAASSACGFRESPESFPLEGRQGAA